MPLTLPLCRYKFNDRKAPTNKLTLSLVLVDIVSMVEKSLRWGALHCLAISSYIIHLWRELGKISSQKKGKVLYQKKG